MYERTNPYFEHFAGGYIDMTDCVYDQYDEKTTRITGPKFIPHEGRIKVKLEGSAKVGEMYLGIAGVRDPHTIENIDKVLELSRASVEEKYGKEGYELNFIVYGRDGVMQDLEPVKKSSPMNYVLSFKVCIQLKK